MGAQDTHTSSSLQFTVMTMPALSYEIIDACWTATYTRSIVKECSSQPSGLRCWAGLRELEEALDAAEETVGRIEYRLAANRRTSVRRGVQTNSISLQKLSSNFVSTWTRTSAKSCARGFSKGEDDAERAAIKKDSKVRASCIQN
jgi:hypothetical protein